MRDRLKNTAIKPGTEGPGLEQYQAELHRYLARCLRQRQDADDLLQDVYVRFLQSPHQALVRQPRAYLYRIASNVVAELNLQLKRRPVTYDSQAAEQGLENESAANVWSDALGEQLHQHRQLQRMLQQLPKPYRAVLLLRARDGLSYEEISVRLDLAQQTVKKYLFRALAQFRAARWER